MKLQRMLVYFLYIFGFIGSSILSITFGGIGFYPLRILLICFVLITGFHILYTQRVNTLLFNNKYFIFLIIWFTYSILLLPFSPNYSQPLTELAIFFEVILVVIFTNIFLKKIDHYYTLFRIILVGVFLISIIGWYNFITGNYLEVSRYYELSTLSFAGYNIPTSVFTNQNNLGVFLALFLPLFYSAIKIAKNKLYKIIVFLIIISLVIMIILTGSRGAIFAVAFGLAVFLFIGSLQKNKTTYTSYFYNIIILILSIIGLAIFLISIDDVLNHIYFFTTVDTSNLIRINLIKQGLDFLNSSYGFGIGLGNFENWMIAKEVKYYTGNIMKIHNWLAEVFVKSGYIIGVLYLVFYFSTIKDLFGIFRKQNKKSSIIARGLLTSFLILFIAGSVPSSFFDQRFHWLLLAFTINFIIIHESKHIKES